jgi:hypothetical protein
VAALAGAAAVALIVSQRPRYEAAVVAATVSNAPTLNLSGAASLLGAGAQASGFSANPALVANLFTSRRVLQVVGTSTLADGRTRVVDVAAGTRVPGPRVERTMHEYVRARVDRETGLITVRVAHPDSALARVVANRLLGETTRMFVQTARAQASEQRRAQEARVDSAERRLRRAQEEYQAFLSENRILAEFATGNLRRRALEREMTLAEGVYTRAASDREAAVAKELEETPVLVVVDPLPDELPRLPRFAVVIGFAAALVAGVIAVLWVFVAEAFRRHAASAPEDARRLREAMGRLGGRPDRPAPTGGDGIAEPAVSGAAHVRA